MEVSGLERRISPRALVAGLEIALAGAVAALLALLCLALLSPIGSIGEQPLGGGMQADAAASAQGAGVDVFWPASRARQAAYQGPWVLHGLSFRLGREAAAILSQGRGKEQLVVRVGEALNDSTSLVAVGRDYAELEASGVRNRIYLDDAPAPLADAPRTNEGANTQTGLTLPGPLPVAALAQYGLRAGDVLLAVNGQAVRNVGDVRALATAAQTGQSVRVRVRRGDEIIEKEIR
jgi:hypothetical protein